MVRQDEIAASLCSRLPARRVPHRAERWRATFEHWMENIRDWNISRQLGGAIASRFQLQQVRIPMASRTDRLACPEATVEEVPSSRIPTCSKPVLILAVAVRDVRMAPAHRRFGAVLSGHTLVTAPEILQLWSRAC